MLVGVGIVGMPVAIDYFVGRAGLREFVGMMFARGSGTAVGMSAVPQRLDWRKKIESVLTTVTWSTVLPKDVDPRRMD